MGRKSSSSSLSFSLWSAWRYFHSWYCLKRPKPLTLVILAFVSFTLLDSDRKILARSHQVLIFIINSSSGWSSKFFTFCVFYFWIFSVCFVGKWWKTGFENLQCEYRSSGISSLWQCKFVIFLGNVWFL